MAQHFLLIDDDPNTLAVFGSVLQEIFPRVKLSTYPCGHDAIQWLEQKEHRAEVDLVFSDYNMAGGDGGSLAHFCYRHGIPCIIVSGYDPEDIEPYLPQGITQLAKGEFVKPSQLTDAVHRALQTDKA